MIIILNDEKIKINNVKRVSGSGGITGLMFKGKNYDKVLLFDFISKGKPTRMKIHSLFCPKFLAVWLDNKNKVIESKIIKPFRLSVGCKREFSRLIEIPFNNRYKPIFEKLQIAVENGKV